MFRTAALSTLGMAVAVGGPIAGFTAYDHFNNKSTPALAEIGGEEVGVPLPPGDPAGGKSASTAANLPLEGAPVRHVSELLRFDVTPDWIVRRWPRVSSGLAELQLQGYRVPVVTGTAPGDLAGALTYYFNVRQQVERITFHGTTGDVRPLVNLMTRQYRMVRRPINDPGLLVYEAAYGGDRPNSVLRIRSAGTIDASDPYHSFEIDLVMQRPS